MAFLNDIKLTRHSVRFRGQCAGYDDVSAVIAAITREAGQS